LEQPVVALVTATPWIAPGIRALIPLLRDYLISRPLIVGNWAFLDSFTFFVFGQPNSKVDQCDLECVFNKKIIIIFFKFL